jgi:hypothetical protein
LKNLPSDRLSDSDPRLKASIRDIQVASDTVMEFVDGVTELVDVEVARVPFSELGLKRRERGGHLPFVGEAGQTPQLLALCLPEGIRIDHYRCVAV